MSSNDDEHEGTEVPTGFRDRTLKTLKLAGSLGKGYLQRTMDQFGDDTGLDVEKALKLVDELGTLRGLLAKFGQMASYLPGELPAEVRRILSELQDDAAAMPFDDVEDVFLHEFDRSPHRMFDHFEPRPFAAASIGQVHRARNDGKDLAVKVQYPHIQKAVDKDLRTIGMLARVTTLGMPIDAVELAAELRDRIGQECDYERELYNQQMFRDLLADIPGCRVPKPYREWSSRRVLTSEYVDALTFQEFVDTADQSQKDRAGELIFSTCFRSIFNHCVYNADPHPGNYLFDGDEVVFLDFGCIRSFEPEMIATWKGVARSVIDGDRRRFEELYPQLGLVPDPDDFDWDHQWKVMKYLYRPYLSSEDFAFTPEYIKESYSLMVFDNPNQRRMSLPREWLFLNRLQWGLYAVLAQLEATAPWGEIWREVISTDTEPMSPRRRIS